MLSTIPDPERLGPKFMICLARGSSVALVALVTGLAGVLLELVPWVRNEITQEFPFTTSLVSAGLLLVLTVVVVEAYLDELDRRQAARDRERAERAWEPSADRVRAEISRAVGHPSGLVITALLRLGEAEKESRKADRTDVAGPLDAAAEELTQALNSWLPILLRRSDLTEVAQRGEDILQTLTTVSWTILKEETTSDDVLVRASVEVLQTHEQWFFDELMRTTDARVREIMGRLEA